MAKRSYSPWDGLPPDAATEKLCLGAALLSPESANLLITAVNEDAWGLEPHRRIFAAIKELIADGVAVDRITVADRLSTKGQLESVGGLAAIVTLDTGLPDIVNLEDYIKILKTKAALRQIQLLSQETFLRAGRGDSNPDEIITSLSSGMDRIANSDNQLPRPQLLKTYIETFEGGISKLLDPSLMDTGIPTGLTRLDELTGGFHESEIFIIGARVGHGKTSIALNIAKAVAKTGKHVVFFSLEMPKRRIFERLICEQSEIGKSRWRRGGLDREDRRKIQEAMSVVSELKISVDDTSGLTAAELAMRVKTIHQKDPVALVCIDFFQLMRSMVRGNENERLTEIANNIQVLAKDTGIPILLLSQLNREVEKRTNRGKKDPRPQLSDLRGSGTLEQIANVVALLYREYLSDPAREDLRERAEFIVPKNRDGETGSFQARFRGWCFRFEDLPKSFENNA